MRPRVKRCVAVLAGAMMVIAGSCGAQSTADPDAILAAAAESVHSAAPAGTPVYIARMNYPDPEQLERVGRAAGLGVVNLEDVLHCPSGCVARETECCSLFSRT